MSEYTDARKRMAEDAAAAPSGTFRCFAEECPMAGTIGVGARANAVWCAYHFGAHASNLARVTSVLNQHHDLRDVINHGRWLLCYAEPTTLAAEWKRLRDLLMFAGYEPPPAAGRETLAGWLYRCETLLGRYVIEATGGQPRAAAPVAPSNMHLSETAA